MITVFMVMTMLPNVVLAENAAHANHYACGEASCTHGNHTEELAYTALTQESFTGGELASGSYYLAEDITLVDGKSIVVPRDTVLNLCLNGHIITRGTQTDCDAIKVYGTLNLCDCNTSTTHKFSVDSSSGLWTLDDVNGTKTVTGGVITGVNVSNRVMGAVAVGGSDEEGSCAGTFNMYGGNLVGNKSAGATGVSISESGSVFNMYGGSICGNSSTNGSGAVAVGSSTTFNMHGGEISHNTAISGGGVFVDGTFNMHGGEIKNNIAAEKGGGVYAVSSNAIITIKGNPYIYNNTKVDGTQSNLYLPDGVVVQITDYLGYNTAKIGVTTATDPTASTPIVIAKHTGLDGIFCDYFVSDKADEGFKSDKTTAGDEVALYTEYPHIHRECGLNYCPHDSNVHRDLMFIPITQADVTANGGKLPVEAGKAYYLKENITLSGTEFTNITFDVKLCLNRRTITTDVDQYTAIKVSGGGSFTLCDCSMDYYNPQSHGEGAILGKNYSNGTVCVMSEDGNKAVFTMYGGVLKGNNNKNGANVNGAITGDHNSEIYLLGGKITENKARNGVAVNGNLYVGGNAVVSGNGVDGNPCNIELPYGKAVRISDEVMLKDGASFGITTFAEPTIDSPIIITDDAYSNHSKYFFSDKGYEIIPFTNESTSKINLRVVPGHSHKACGKSCTHEGHTENLSYKALTRASFTGGELDSGNYYLAEDISLTTPITMKDGATVNICLNGKLLKAPSGSYAIFFTEGRSENLTICDCGTNERSYTVGTDGLASLDEYGSDGKIVGGAIMGAGDTSNSGGIRDWENYNGVKDTLRLYNVNFVNNRNRALDVGTNGVDVLEMDNCSVIGNQSDYIALVEGNSSKVNLSNITVKHNVSEYYVMMFTVSGADVKWHNCEITDNKFTLDGVDLYKYAVDFGGSGKSATLSGKIVIKDNHYNLEERDILINGSTIKAENLEEGSEIWLSAYASDLEASPLLHVATGISKDYVKYFKPTGSYIIDAKKNADDPTKRDIYFGTHSHAKCSDASCTAHTENINYLPLTQADVDNTYYGHLPINGAYFLTEDIVVSDKTYTNSNNLNLCLNGYTISTDSQIDGSFIEVGPYGKVALTDCSEDDSNPYGKGGITSVETRKSVIELCGGEFEMYKSSIRGCDANVALIYFNASRSKATIIDGEINDNNFGCSFDTDIPEATFIVGGKTKILARVSAGITLMDNRLITIDENKPLEDGAEITVLTQTTPTAGNPIKITNESSGNYARFFETTNKDCEVVPYKDGGTAIVLKNSLLHRHNLCGDADCTHGEHSENLTYKALTQANITDYVKYDSMIILPDGNYYLAEDITLPHSIKHNGAYNINLCLNGHTLTAPDNSLAIYLAYSGSNTCNFTMCDCSNENREYTLQSGETVVLRGGAILGKGAKRLGGVHIQSEKTSAAAAFYNINFVDLLSPNHFYRLRSLTMEGCTFAENDISGYDEYLLRITSSTTFDVPTALSLKNLTFKGNTSVHTPLLELEYFNEDVVTNGLTMTDNVVYNSGYLLDILSLGTSDAKLVLDGTINISKTISSISA